MVLEDAENDRVWQVLTDPIILRGYCIVMKAYISPKEMTDMTNISLLLIAPSSEYTFHAF